MKKKGVSNLVAYSLLIVITLVLSTMVYFWLRFNYVEADVPACPEGVKVVVNSYVCNNGTDGNITVTFKNKGLFDVDGYTLRVSGRDDAERGTYIYDKDGAFLESGKSSGELTYSFDEEEGGLDIITLLDVQPFMREKGKISCRSYASQRIVCNGEDVVVVPSVSCNNDGLDIALGEECDGDGFGGFDFDVGNDSCSEATGGIRPMGSLSCNSDCTIDMSGCTALTCGNGFLDAGEECDRVGGVYVFGGKNCSSESPDTPFGSVTCTSTCTIDTSACYDVHVASAAISYFSGAWDSNHINAVNIADLACSNEFGVGWRMATLEDIVSFPYNSDDWADNGNSAWIFDDTDLCNSCWEFNCGFYSGCSIGSSDCCIRPSVSDCYGGEVYGTIYSAYSGVELGRYCEESHKILCYNEDYTP